MKSPGAWGWSPGFLLAAALAADRPPTSSPPAEASLAQPPVRRLTNGELEIGRVRLNEQRREVRFPVTVNQRTGVVEYAVVTLTGKTHESVFRCEAEPQHVQLALLLLGAKPASTNQFPSDPTSPLPGEPVRLDVRWTQAGRDITRPLEDCLMTLGDWAPLPSGPWVFNGSYLADGQFVAQREGSIVAVYLDTSALINNPRPGRFNDDLHWVNPTNLPPDGVEVHVAVRLPGNGAAPPASPGASQPGSREAPAPPPPTPAGSGLN